MALLYLKGAIEKSTEFAHPRPFGILHFHRYSNINVITLQVYSFELKSGINPLGEVNLENLTRILLVYLVLYAL